jgi:uncharacterized protein YecT (DUF1311 family)
VVSAVLFLIAIPVAPSAHALASAEDARSLAALKATAEKGAPQAQLEYARALYDEDRPASRVWAQKAADQGLAEAWFWLGQTTGDGAASFYEKAAEGGYAEAFWPLLERLLFRAGEGADVVKAKKFADLARKLDVDLGADAAGLLATIDRCFEAGSPEIPETDLPTEEETATFATGDDCLVYLEGVGRQADPARYGRCLLSEGEADNNLLAELYANGWGVKRNARLAIALVCHGSDVPAELEGMVETLYRTRGRAALEEDFLFCDHATSGMSQSLCASRAEASAAIARAAELAALTSTWPQPHRAALEALQKAAEGFFGSRMESEIDLEGTARAAIAIEEEAALRDELLADLRQFEAGSLPSSRESYKAADAGLNAVYSRIMKTKELDLGTVTKEGIRETQRAWLAYRDAWAAFGAARYPGVSADAWKAWATTKRVAQLRELLAR